MKIDIQTQELFSSASGKLKSSDFLLSVALGSVFLGMVMALSTGVISWFDGLPWVGKAETLFIILITPFLLILGYLSLY